MDRPTIREAIVAEGRDDAAVIAQAVNAVCITTHGFGIAQETWALIDHAYHTTGIIILTDPDHAGEEIRRRIAARYPDAKHAFLPRDRAIRGDDIGVENARPEDVAAALLAAKATVRTQDPSDITPDLLVSLGLSGAPGSAALRAKTGAALGIGYGNSRTFLRRAAGFGITREELINTVYGIKEQDNAL